MAPSCNNGVFVVMMQLLQSRRRSLNNSIILQVKPGIVLLHSGFTAALMGGRISHHSQGE